MQRRHIVWAAGLFLASSLLAACGGVATPVPVTTPVIDVQPSPQVEVVTAIPTVVKPVEFHAQDTSTFVQVQSSDPDTIDPAVSTSNEGAAIIQNVYETLVFFKRDSVTNFIPQLAEEVPTLQNGGISPDGLVYTFKIRKGVKFHNGDELTASDVAYSLQRVILSGGSNSPAWLLFEPILGTTPNDDITDLIDPYGTLLDNPQKLVKVLPSGLQAMCNRVQRLIAADDQAGTVTIRLYQPWGPFMMILASPISSVMDQKWVGANGGWNGGCDTWQNYYDRTSDQQNQSLLGNGENGTGPYILDHWTASQEIVLKANPSYWRTQPAWDGGPSGTPALKKINIQIIKGGGARIAAIKAGSADTIGQFSSSKPVSLDELAGQICDLQGQCTDTKTPGSQIRIYQGIPAQTQVDALFNFSINAEGGNTLIGSGQLDGNGIPTNFFTDVNVRKAFSYCFDWNAYIQQALGGQGRQMLQVMLPGEIGSDPNNPHYSYDAQKCTDAFKASVWRSPNGASLWDTGFHMNLVYDSRKPESQIFAEILSQNISAVNPKFVIAVTTVPWESYTDYSRNKKLPIYFTTTREVISDPHNWAQRLTVGTLGSGLQRMSRGMAYQFEYLVNKGVSTTDPAVRAQIYQQFNQLYFDLAPAILLTQSMEKRYEQRWVSGYYYNAMYADLYYYALSKQ